MNPLEATSWTPTLGCTTRSVCPNHRKRLPPPPGPQAVHGVAAIIAEGFEPIESLTGILWIVEVWPAADKRSVPETRSGWLGEQPDSELWLIRSPWPDISTSDALSLVWANLPETRLNPTGPPPPDGSSPGPPIRPTPLHRPSRTAPTCHRRGFDVKHNTGIGKMTVKSATDD
jgi:hypothetical protein